MRSRSSCGLARWASVAERDTGAAYSRVGAIHLLIGVGGPPPARADIAIELAHGSMWRRVHFAAPASGRFALAARRLREDQLAAAQRGGDLAGLLDLRVRVADRVLDGLDVDAWDAH